MALEIKELIIRAEIEHSISKDQSAAGNSSQMANAEVDQAAIVKACVKQVLKIIKQEQKR